MSVLRIASVQGFLRNWHLNGVGHSIIRIGLVRQQLTLRHWLFRWVFCQWFLRDWNWFRVFIFNSWSRVEGVTSILVDFRLTFDIFFSSLLFHGGYLNLFNYLIWFLWNLLLNLLWLHWSGFDWVRLLFWLNFFTTIRFNTLSFYFI